MIKLNDLNNIFPDELKRLRLTEMLEKADNAVVVAAAAATATGAIPIPFADAPFLIGEQVVLMATIAAIFEINIRKDGLKTLALAALSTYGATIIGKTVASNLLKLIPIAGTVVGGAVSAGTAGVVTFTMGKAFIEICKLVKIGKLREEDITSYKGVDMLKSAFTLQLKNRDQLKKKVEQNFAAKV